MTSQCRNDEGAGLGDRFAHQINQGFVNAVVADARRGEKILHDASPNVHLVKTLQTGEERNQSTRPDEILPQSR